MQVLEEFMFKLFINISIVIVQYIGRSVGVDCDCYDLEKCDIIAAGVGRVISS